MIGHFSEIRTEVTICEVIDTISLRTHNSIHGEVKVKWTILETV